MFEKSKVKTLLKKNFYRRKKNVALWVKRMNSMSKLIKIGILSPRNYIAANSKSIDEILKNTDYSYTAYYQEDKIKRSRSLDVSLNEMGEFISKTETIFLSSIDDKFSFRANHLITHNFDILGTNKVGGVDAIKGLPVWNNFFIRANRKKLKGTVAYLSNSDPGNYYHWMALTLPLLNYYQKEVGLENIDWYYVGKLNSANKKTLLPFQKETLDKLGIRTDKIIHEDCTANKLLAVFSHPNLCFGGHHIDSESYNFVRRLFLEKLNFQHKNSRTRIYVLRGNVDRRKVMNESAIINLLDSYGFSTVSMDNLSVVEQAEIFNQAEAIVAPHGAALTNLFFIQEKTKVIELMPYGYINNCFHVLANFSNADYYYLRGKQIKQKGLSELRGLNIEIDVKKLKNICELANL